MKIEELVIRNFLAIGEAEIALADRGLLLIQGENNDDSSANSNGAGKSTIPDALCWALFGVTARGISGDSVVNRETAKNTIVEVKICDGERTYWVARHRKHVTYKNGLTLNDVTDIASPINLTKGTERETQVEIEKILGCTYDVFRAAVYCGQEQMPDLPGMTDKQLKTLIEEAAGIDVLERAYEIARERKRAQDADVEKKANAVERTSENIARLTADLDMHNKRASEWGVEQKKRIELIKQSAAEQLEEAKGFKAKAAGLPAVEAELEAIAAKLEATSAETVERNRLAKIANDVSSREAINKAEYERDCLNAKAKKKQIDNIASQIGKPCPECGKPCEEHDVAGAKEAQVAQLRALVATAQATNKAYEAASQSALEARTALSDYESTMTDVSELIALQREKNALRAELTKQRDLAGRATARAEELIGKLGEVKKETNPHVEAVSHAEEVLEGVKETLEGAVSALEDAESGLEVAKKACEVYGPAGVRAHILDTVTPYLNTRTAHYLGSLSDGSISAVWSTISTSAKGELKEKFEIKVENEYGAAQFAGLSGGEKRKVRIATALALQDLVASRASKPIDLWIGDEVDDALDVSGLERLMGILEEKARERGTVLVISHADLKDWIRDQVTVSKKGGVSTIMESAA